MTPLPVCGTPAYLSASERFRGRPVSVRIASTLAVIAIHAAAALVLLHHAAPRVGVIDGMPLQVMLFSEERTLRPEIPVPTPQVLPPAIDVELPMIDLSELAVEPDTSTAIAVATAPQSMSLRTPVSTPRVIYAVEYLREPRPRYPPASRRLGEEGLVVLRVLIDTQGDAREIELQRSSGHERLDQAAREAVARAEFKPYQENGRAFPAIVLVPIEFSLARSSGRGS